MIERTCGDSQPISSENYRFVCDMAMREAAIVLGEGKEYLVESRLAPVATRHRYPSVNALVDYLRIAGAFPQARRDSVDALTTNETFFFRDHHPFESLRESVIPELAERARGRRIIVWSAACATGQEPYSLAMLLQEHFPSLVGQVDIIASDLSTRAIHRAKEGLYHQIEINRGLPASYLVNYFCEESDGWRIAEQIRRRVAFHEINLARPWPLMPRCDLVLIRNVMIYFDLNVRRQILRQVRDVLAPGGLMLLGGAETTLMVDDGFTPRTIGKTTFYTLNPHG